MKATGLFEGTVLGQVVDKARKKQEEQALEELRREERAKIEEMAQKTKLIDEMIEAMGKPGQALRPYMDSRGARLWGESRVTVKVSLPEHEPFWLQFETGKPDLRVKNYPDGSSGWSMRVRDWTPLGKILIGKREEWLKEAERWESEIRDYLDMIRGGGGSDKKIEDWLEKAEEYSLEVLPALKLAIQLGEQEREKREQARADREWRRKQYQEEWRAWEAERDETFVANQEVLRKLQAQYDEPFCLFTLTYGVVAVDEGDPHVGRPGGDIFLETRPAWVMELEPDAEGFWKVVKQHSGGKDPVVHKRFTHVVSVAADDKELLPSDGRFSRKVYIQEACEYLHLSPFWHGDLDSLVEGIRSEMKPLPKEPKRADFGLEE